MNLARPVGGRVLQGAVLAMAGLIASLGMTFGCMIRNLVRSPGDFLHNFEALGAKEVSPASAASHGHLRGTGLADIGVTLLFALLMLVWAIALTRFVRAQPRDPLTWGLTVVILTVFVWSSLQTWLYAWPVCNSF